MNPEAQAELNRILAIDPKNLTEDDKAFLRARSSYLKESQKQEYAEALKEPKHQTSEEPETVKSPDAKSK